MQLKNNEVIDFFFLLSLHLHRLTNNTFHRYRNWYWTWLRNWYRYLLEKTIRSNSIILMFVKISYSNLTGLNWYWNWYRTWLSRKIFTT